MASIEDLLAARRLEAVRPDSAAAQAFLDDARMHLENASLILERDDTNGAYALGYDAARKAATAHMRLSGFRLRNRPRAHQAVVDYARAMLDDPTTGEALANLDRIRRTRHASENRAGHIDAAQAAEDIRLIGIIVDAVRGALAEYRDGE